MSKRKVRRKTEPVSLEEVRHQLFYVWCGLFVAYVCIFLFSSLKENVGFPLAIDATWRVAYLIVPVLGAFAGYWFSGGPPQADELEVLDRGKRKIIFVLTAMLHGVVFLIIVVGVILVDYRDQEEPVSYPQRVDLVLKFMLLIWSVSLLPIGWLLKGQKIPVPGVPDDSD